MKAHRRPIIYPRPEEKKGLREQFEKLVFPESIFGFLGAPFTPLAKGQRVGVLGGSIAFFFWFTT
jgi:hypothetical protein